MLNIINQKLKLIMNDNKVEIIKDKLYWISDDKYEKGLTNTMYFTVDN